MKVFIPLNEADLDALGPTEKLVPYRVGLRLLGQGRDALPEPAVRDRTATPARRPFPRPARPPSRR